MAWRMSPEGELMVQQLEKEEKLRKKGGSKFEDIKLNVGGTQKLIEKSKQFICSISYTMFISLNLSQY